MQILDDGRITDSQGRMVNFTNTVVILTSNIGSNYLMEAKEDDTTVEDLVMAALRQHFKPELLNRMDDIILFHALSDQHFTAITWKYVEQLIKRVAEQDITLAIDQEVIDWVVEQGADPQFGARPLKRFVQRHIETAVAKELLRGEILPGETLHVTMRDGQCVVEQ